MMDEPTLNQRLVEAGFSQNLGIYKREVVNIVQDRVGGLCADHRTFLYVRINSLHIDHHLGGGNITSAIAAFSALSLLSKVCYFIDKPTRFIPADGVYFKVNETDAFCHFIKLLADKGILLGVNRDDPEGQKLIWNGFRDYLAHLGTVEHGKQVVTFEFKQLGEDEPVLSLDERVKRMAQRQVFEHDGSGRNWRTYIDVLFSKIEEVILPCVVEKVIEYKTDERSARDLFKLVAGRSDLE